MHKHHSPRVGILILKFQFSYHVLPYISNHIQEQLKHLPEKIVKQGLHRNDLKVVKANWTTHHAKTSIFVQIVDFEKMDFEFLIEKRTGNHFK